MSRKTGKTLAMIQRMVFDLLMDQSTSIIGCDDPDEIVQKLSRLGLEVTIEPITKRPPQEVFYNEWGEIIGYGVQPKTETTGYTFKLKEKEE